MADSAGKIPQRGSRAVSARVPAALPQPPEPLQGLRVPLDTVRGLTANDVLRLQRTLGNHATAALLRGANRPATKRIQRQLKIDEYEWSWIGIPYFRIGYQWATGAEDLFKKLKKAFDIDLPAAITALESTGEKDPQQLAGKLRAVQTKYSNKPLAYKKAVGKLSGEGLDAKLSPLLSQADSALKSSKLALVTKIRGSLASVGSYVGNLSTRTEFDRINMAVPKGSDGSTLDFATLKALAVAAANYEQQMQTEIKQLQSAKLAQSATPTTPSKTNTVLPDDALKKLCKEEKGWKEAESKWIMIDPSDPTLKEEVVRTIVHGEIGALNTVLGQHKLTLEQVRKFLFDHGVQKIGELNWLLVEFGDAAALDNTLKTIGYDGINELLKRKVPGKFIGQHAGQGKSLVETLQAYKQSLPTVAQGAQPYDPISQGVDPTKNPLHYTKLEAYLQFLGKQMPAKGVNLTLHHTYSSTYDGEHGIGAEYWPNGTPNTWVVHVHRGPNGGLKVGSVKDWSERMTLGHSQKLTIDQLTSANVPQVDTTRTHT